MATRAPLAGCVGCLDVWTSLAFLESQTIMKCFYCMELGVMVRHRVVCNSPKDATANRCLGACTGVSTRVAVRIADVGRKKNVGEDVVSGFRLQIRIRFAQHWYRASVHSPLFG